MAIAFGVGSTGSANATSLTFAHTVGTGRDRFLFVGVSTQSIIVNSVTYGGVNVPNTGYVVNGTTSRIVVYSLVAPPSGTANVVVTIASAGEVSAGATSWTGVHQTTPLGTFATATGTSNAPAVAVASAAGDVVHDALGVNSTSISSFGANQAGRWISTSPGTVSNIVSAASTESGAASVTMSYGLGASKSWSIVAVPIKPAPEEKASSTTTGLATSESSVAVSVGTSTTAGLITSSLTAGEDRATGTVVGQMTTGLSATADIEASTVTSELTSSSSPMATTDSSTEVGAITSSFVPYLLPIPAGSLDVNIEMKVDSIVSKPGAAHGRLTSVSQVHATLAIGNIDDGLGE